MLFVEYADTKIILNIGLSYRIGVEDAGF